MVIPLAVLLPVFSQAKKSALRSESLSNVKRLATAMALYTTNNDEVYPPASEWQTKISSYVTDSDAWTVPPAAQPASYAFNSALDGASIFDLPSYDDIPMIFESNLTGQNAHGGIGSVLYRDDRAIIAMVDASARTLGKADAQSLNWTPFASSRR